MSICYYLPGLSGSSLVSQASGAQYWGSVSASVTTPLSRLALSADGLTPLGPCGVALVPSGIYVDYYGPAFTAFIRSLLGEGMIVQAYSWDWRLTLLNLGASLAAVIQTQVTSDDPCSIVAHSAGGLVARAAWLALSQLGMTALVRRIVTYGTPHQGSYGPVQLWSLDSSSLDQVQYLAIVRVGLIGRVLPNICDYVSAPALAGVTTTWPALYDVLPLLGGSEASDDPNRSLLFSAENWLGPVSPAQAWLSYAISTTQAWLSNPASIPPSWVLTTIAGDGILTAGQLSRPQYLGSILAYSIGSDGDGTVTVGSALISGSMQYVISGRHGDLPLLLASNGLLARAVLEVRTPPTPPPPQVSIPGPVVPLLGGPPIPSLGYPAGGQSPMRGC
jgi:hypothetical protein